MSRHGPPSAGGVVVFEFPIYISGRCTLTVPAGGTGKAGDRVTLIHSPVQDATTGRVVMQVRSDSSPFYLWRDVQQQPRLACNCLVTTVAVLSISSPSTSPAAMST